MDERTKGIDVVDNDGRKPQRSQRRLQEPIGTLRNPEKIRGCNQAEQVGKDQRNYPGNADTQLDKSGSIDGCNCQYSSK